MSDQSRLPVRSRRYGVGKEIGGAVYVHRAYEERMGPVVVEAKERLPSDFEYTVIKYQLDTSVVSFIHSPDFDTAPEPTVGASWMVFADGTTKVGRQVTDPYIYHHKWLFVEDDYPGFCVEESKRRSLAWVALAGIDRKRIGRSRYWVSEVLPRLAT